jgi:uncharacterized protein (DUF697 family)
MTLETYHKRRGQEDKGERRHILKIFFNKEEDMEMKEKEEKRLEAAEFETMDLDGRKVWTNKAIKNHALGAMGIGLIPLPVVDFVALTTLQLRLLYKLSKFYNVRFIKGKGKNIIASMLGGYIPVSMAGPIASLVKAIPIVGQTSGVLAMSSLAGATTYALGKVFVQHFESGGTLLDFDPATLRDYFAEQFKEGEKATEELKKGAPLKSTS